MKTINYTWEEYSQDRDKLISIIKESGVIYDGVYGVPRGWLLLASQLSNALWISQIYNNRDLTENTLIVDDIADSWRTLSEFENNHTAVLFLSSDSSFSPTYSVRESKEWVTFPWEGSKEKDAEGLIVRILEHIWENPNRSWLKGTPERVVRMWKEIFRGYDESQKPKMAIFKNGDDWIRVDEMVVDTGYYFSHCEHHMVPFFWDYYFAYIPDKKIIGLSKVARIVDYYSAKLQIQERLVKEILDEIEKELEPLGCALVMKWRHLCKEMRWVKKVNGFMMASDLRGVFKTKNEVRQEFLSLTNK